MADVEEAVIVGEVVEEGEREVEEERQRAELVPSDHHSIVRADEWTVEDLLAQVEKVEQVMKRAMKPDVHYGVIPGTGTKPTLLKPGAERLNVMFRLAPSYPPERTKIEFHDDGHMTVVAVCVETHIPTGQVWGEGLGMCTTREQKYAERDAELICPVCNTPNVRRSKRDDEFFCWRKLGGCGATFPLDDEKITGQVTGKVANPQLADMYNTVLKMACKRALLAAVLNATAASDVFTQDMEDKAKPVGEYQPANPQPDVPRNWSELVAAWKDALAFDPAPWFKAAVVTLYGVDSVTELDPSTQEQFFRKLCTVYLSLHEPGDWATEEQIAKAFADTLGGPIPSPAATDPRDGAEAAPEPESASPAAAGLGGKGDEPDEAPAHPDVGTEDAADAILDATVTGPPASEKPKRRRSS